jgi:hypothetical protein
MRFENWDDILAEYEGDPYRRFAMIPKNLVSQTLLRPLISTASLYFPFSIFEKV